MKIAPVHYSALLTAVEDEVRSRTFGTAVTCPEFLKFLAENYKAKNLTGTRLIWDLLWATTRNREETMKGWFDEVYQYANDDHIETALRRVWKDLGGPL